MSGRVQLNDQFCLVEFLCGILFSLFPIGHGSMNGFLLVDWLRFVQIGKLLKFCLVFSLCSKKIGLHSTQAQPAQTDNTKVLSFNLADIGEGIAEVTVKEWFVQVGDHVHQFDNICEVQSDKASVTITSKYDGIIHKLHYGVDDLARVGKPLVDIEVVEDSTGEPPIDVVDSTKEVPIASAAKEASFENDFSSTSKILTTPAVRRLAMEFNVNLAQVPPTGPHGRILKEDVLKYISHRDSSAQPRAEAPVVASSTNAATSKLVAKVKPTSQPSSPLPQQPNRTEPLKGIAKAMFKSMTQSLQVPHFGLSEEIDLTKLVEMKPELKKISSEQGVPLTFMPFFIKAVSIALADHPILNSSVDKEKEEVIYKSSHNIGVAMDTKHGLLVPNIKHVNQRTVLDVARELARLQELAKAGTLGTDDLSGGTFTLSNVGSVILNCRGTLNARNSCYFP